MISEYQRYVISENSSIEMALIALENNSNSILTLLIVNKEGKLVGTLTDGDVRRGLINGWILKDEIKKIMNTSFKYISNDIKAVSIIKEYKQKGIKLLPYLNKDGKVEKLYNLKKISSILPVDAILMAGGKGERLRPLTLKTPKPLLKVGNKCIIDYNVDALINYGIENIFVSINYLGEQLEEHFKLRREHIQVKCIREPKFLGTFGSVKFVETFENETVLVMNSDLFTNIDLEDYYLDFEQKNADMSVAAVPYSINVPYGIFELNGSLINGINEKPTFNYYANAGIYLIKKKYLEFIPENTFYNATDFLEMLISKGLKVIRYPITSYWIDIGKPEDYVKAQELSKHL